MQNTHTLQQRYHDVQSLPHLDQPRTLDGLIQLEALQHARLKQQYASDFATPTGQHALHLFCQHIYHHQSIFLLNEQIEEALKQKIKFERWLSQDLLNSIAHAYSMAYESLKLDLELLHSCCELSHRAPEDLVQVYVKHGQLEARLKQLDDLQMLLDQCERYANSFLIRSALRMAKSTLMRRGFAALYQFLSLSLNNFKGQQAAVQLMRQVIAQEKQQLQALAEI